MKLFAQSKIGMTLIEILIVVSLISMVSLSLFTFLSQGLQVWKKSQEFRVEQDVALFFDRLTDDVRNLLLYSVLPITGNESEISFSGIVHSGDLQEEQIGVINYRFDFDKNVVWRRQADYGESLRKEFSAEREVLSGVKKVRFTYVYLTDIDVVKSRSMYDNLPHSIEVEVVLADKYGERVIKKIIDLPIMI